jgi:hypothetical protein
VTTLTRREWAALLAAVPMSAVAAAGSFQEDRLRAWASAHVPASDLAALARAYEQRHPSEPVTAIEAALLSDRPADVPLATHLARQAQRDFANGDLEDLEGWMLSRTEARLIALAAGQGRP